MNKTDRFCRFCLKELRGTSFENVEGNVRNMSSVLKLEMDLDVSEEPVICVDCVENLQRLYSFKVICIETENHLSPFINFHTHMQIDMAQVYLKINGDKSLDDKNICRFCMSEIPSDVSIDLDTVINAMPSIKNLLEGFLPEIDTTLVRNPIICKTCHSCLQDYLIFTNNCISVEKIITKCIETEGISPEEKVDLKNVQQFLNKEVIKNEIVEVNVKQEIHQNEDEFLENLSFNMDIGSENFLPTEESTLDMRAVEYTPLTVENIIKQEVDEFNEIKNIEQCCESPAHYSCSEYNLKVESKEDIKYLYAHDNQFPIMESNKCCKHKTNRDFSQPDMQSSNSTLQTPKETNFKNDRLGDETVLGVVKTYKCSNKDCSYKTKDKSNFNRHMLIHQGPSKVKMYKCDRENCTFKTKYKDYLSKHNLVHKDLSEVKVYKCENEGCPFETKHKASWIHHKLIHKDPSEVTVYRCKNEGCSFVTLYRKSLANHTLVHENKAEVPIYKCEYGGCSFETKYKTSMSRHQLTHKDLSEVIYKCRIGGCSYETKSKGSFTMHNLFHKDSSEMITYKCKYEGCSYETKRKGNLVSHGFLHKDLLEVTTYKCGFDDCSFETNCKISLTKHNLVHKNFSELTMYKCMYDGCSFKTKHRKSLSRHGLVHKDLSDVTTYKCENEDCCYETKHKSSLIRHRLNHKDLSEITMHKCENENCSYETKRKNSLINHKLVHKDSSEVTMHKCENEGCSFETKYKRNLLLHKKRVHKESLEVSANKRKKEDI